MLKEHGIRYVDAGTSGGIWGLANGFCLMVGGDREAVEPLEPIFRSLPRWTATCTPAHRARALREDDPQRDRVRADAGLRRGLRDPPRERVPLDLAAISDLWNHGSVVRSWLLELATDAFRKGGADLSELKGWVADSGEGRWTVQEAIDRDVPAPIITLALQTRFRSRQDDSYGARVLAALRNEFGGHAVKNT
jgi:6-phosphogluconate dehydrogenase